MNHNIKIKSYYERNRKERMEYAKNRYHSGGGKAKARKYCDFNRTRCQEQSQNSYGNLSKKKKEKKC